MYLSIWITVTNCTIEMSEVLDFPIPDAEIPTTALRSRRCIRNMVYYYGSVEMFKKTWTLKGGFTPAALCSPTNTITPGKVIHHHRAKRSGCKVGQARSPPLSYLCFLLHILIKGILQSR